MSYSRSAMQEHFFTERGIYYRTNEFQADRQTLIFIHGLSASSSAWQPYEEILGRNYNVLTLDLRGHGKSDKPRHREDYAIEHLVQDIESLITQLNIKRFALISHSFGTAIALQLLIHDQEKVEEAIFLSPIFNIEKNILVRVTRGLVRGCANMLEYIPFSGKTGRHVDYARYQQTGDWNVRRISADVPNTSFHVYFYCLDHGYHLESEDALRTLRVPTLIIHGMRDTMMPVAIITEAVEQIATHKLVLLPNANHMIVLNNVEEVSSAITDFIK